MPLERIEGRNAVLEALRAGRNFDRLLIGAWLQRERMGKVVEVLKEARRKGVRIQWTSRNILNSLVPGGEHGGVVGFAGERRYATVDALFRRGGSPLILVLDGIGDPQNLGSVLRSAGEACVDGVLFSKGRSAPLSPAAVRASAGAAEHLNILREGDLAAALRAIKSRGVLVVGADAGAPKACDEVKLTGPVALVVGNEERGISVHVRELCDDIVRVPLRGPVGCLGVAASAAILLYEAVRQRRAQAGKAPGREKPGADLLRTAPSSGIRNPAGNP